MFRSFASSLISFLAILLFAFTFLFLWSGSEGIKFKRVAMDGDRSTAQILEDLRKKRMAQYNATEEPEPVEMAPVQTSKGDGPPVVVWISIPGFRGDYLEKAETPFFDEVVAAGAGTNKMRPNFPCLTFPAHATMATGVTPDKHGIVADRIRTAPGEVVEQPTSPELLLAEPIWTTATKQGIVTLVHDWPLSQNQTGEHASANFLDSFNPDATDEERLNKALEDWRKLAGAGAAAAPASDDTEAPADDAEAESGGEAPADDAADAPAGGGTKPRLVMLKLDDILKAGLVNGPRTDETYAAIAKTDAALKGFFDTVQKEWSTLANPDANLVLFITTDHGMAERDKNVNIAHLLGDEMMANADIVAHDAVANLYFKGLPESEGEKKIFLDKFDGELGKRIYFRTLTKEDLPADWNYVSERTGDRVLVLKTGYAFVDEKADEPVFDPAAGNGFFGGYGYPVEDSSRMSGQIMMGGFPNAPLSELDETTHLTFHATVCKLLGIDPAEGAATETLGVD